MGTTKDEERLRHLFQAFRDKNDSAFVRVAEGIISAELAANHYRVATDLQQALGKGKEKSMANGTKFAELKSVPPKDKRSGEDLFWLIDSPAPPVVFFSPLTQKRISRILDEHRREVVLRKHGYTPKSKLLFWGPPGCGKTLTAQYLAHELGLPFGIVRLDAVISSFLGDTASHLHRVMERAHSIPMVLLIDEADALAKYRDDPNDIGELKRVVNSFLQAMDAFSSTQSILITASNHQYLFDPALWRRFDDIIEFELPKLRCRQAYVKYLLNGIKFEGVVADIARKMAAMSYDEIRRVLTEAIKTMLLLDRGVLVASDVLSELQMWKHASQRAKKRNETSKE
jgi:hypothetical protein